LEERNALERCVRREGSDGVPWRNGPSADGVGVSLGPALDASGRGALPPGNLVVGEFL
jgi:hypothetical protein